MVVGKRKETKREESTKRGESVRDTPHTSIRMPLEKKQKIKRKEKKKNQVAGNCSLGPTNCVEMKSPRIERAIGTARPSIVPQQRIRLAISRDERAPRACYQISVGDCSSGVFSYLIISNGWPLSLCKKEEPRGWISL